MRRLDHTSRRSRQVTPTLGHEAAGGCAAGLVFIIKKLEPSVNTLIFGERGDSMRSRRLRRTRNRRESVFSPCGKLPGDSQVSRVGLKRGPKMKFNVPHMVPMVLAPPESKSAVRFELRRKKIANFQESATFSKFAFLQTSKPQGFSAASATDLSQVS